jgi:hypothetical protein
MKKLIAQILEDLNEIELKKVIEYVSFLKFRTLLILQPDVTQMAKREAELAETVQKCTDFETKKVKKRWDKARALEAMKKLKGSGNGRLVAVLLEERQKDRL